MTTAKRDTLGMVLAAAAAVMVSAAAYFAFAYAPTERVMGDVQRIFYFHVGIAWVAGLALFVAFVASILYLARGEQRRYDILAVASVEIGVVFGIMVVLSGMLWARPVWNTWWTWDPRLTTTAIALFIYIAYLMLRGAIDDPQRRARFSAVYGIIAFASVPITFFATRWWNTIHPDLFGQGDFPPLTAQMRTAMFVSLATFSLVYLTLLRMRTRVERAADEVAVLKQQVLSR
ncbi:MAG TPA: cytochrome c biogenesis protein CcsA [Anaerolineae bacterium]|nr:cytochrome c biogenesis protein CcsA [Anaerolineae bacterium]